MQIRLLYDQDIEHERILIPSNKDDLRRGAEGYLVASEIRKCSGVDTSRVNDRHDARIAGLFAVANVIQSGCHFAQWDSEDAIDEFLSNDRVGKTLSAGWHTRLSFLRQWGSISGFEIPEENLETDPPDSPVVAVTLARMKMFRVPRFIRWGRPVEKLVRDHPGTTLSLASIRFPRTVSTFSVWKSEKEMIDMVRGHSSVPRPKRHIDAMKERDRKDFHFEFTTLRFKPISEFGEWNGRGKIIPGLD